MRPRRAPSSSTNIASTTSNILTPSPASPSWTASRWAAASGSRSPAAIALRPSARCWRCRKRRSASFPDVGGGRYLSRLRGRLAQFLALTGARLDGAECLRLRLATHYLPSDRLEEAKERIIAQPFRTQAVLDELSEEYIPDARIMASLPKIDRYFASDRLEDILEALDAGAADGDEWAAKEAATIRAKSPIACKVSLKLLQESPYQLHFVDEMRMEYGIMVRLIHHPDFKEGVRALLIDKDNKPNWHPTRPEVIGDRDVDDFFEPLPPEEQWRPFDF